MGRESGKSQAISKWILSGNPVIMSATKTLTHTHTHARTHAHARGARGRQVPKVLVNIKEAALRPK